MITCEAASYCAVGYFATGVVLNTVLLATSAAGYPNGSIFATRVVLWPWLLSDIFKQNKLKG